MTDNKGGKQNPLLRFFGRPVVGIAGLIASVVSIFLTVYLYLASREKPELTYFVHPAKAAVVRTGQTSRMAVQFDGKNFASDITAAQIAFWNAGRRPIRANAILSPLVIRTGNKERILEARLRKTSRDVVGASLDCSRLASGEVEIRWNILEQNDGGVLQIVYAGTEAVDIQAHAILESQPEIVRLDYTKELRNPGDEYAYRQGWKSRLPNLLAVGAGLLAIMLSLIVLSKRRKIGQAVRASEYFGMLLPAVLMTGIGVWMWLFDRPPGPPFGF
jgi:hypothetical protein